MRTRVRRVASLGGKSEQERGQEAGSRNPRPAGRADEVSWCNPQAVPGRGSSSRLAGFRLVGKGPLRVRSGDVDPPCEPSVPVWVLHEADVDPGQPSPRRRQLLAEAGYTFEVDPSDVAEPDRLRRLANGIRGAPCLAEGDGRRPPAEGGLILAADTVCAVQGNPQQAPRPGRCRADDPAPGRARYRRHHRDVPVPGGTE